MRTVIPRKFVIMCALMAFGQIALYGQNLGALRGTIKDSSGSVVPDAKVTLQAVSSAWMQNVQTDVTGAFLISSIPIGQYTVTVEREGFSRITQSVQITLNSAPNLQLTLAVSGVAQAVTVTEAALEITAPEAPSPPVMVSGNEILDLPGADRMSSLQFITETTPSAFVLHDHLHVRGGHQIDWVMNGVPIPNTNMSSNVGRALDPKDIENVQINRGGYGAQSGDRTFAQVNISTRTGFEFDKEAELTLTYGSFHQTNSQFGLGGHGEKFAYYASVTGNRTDLGLEPPTKQIVHDAGSGQAFFTTMTYDAGPSNQLRWTGSIRNDRFQIPIDPDDPDNAPLRDIDKELDSFGTLTWLHTMTPKTVLTVSPFYHYNNSSYNSGVNDPFRATSRNGSKYFGSQLEIKDVRGPSNLVAGFYGFYQHNSLTFGLAGGGSSASVASTPIGGLAAGYINEQYKPLDWLTLNGGVRVTHFSGILSENAISPRIGGTIEVPKLRWVLRSFYGKYYQAPPLYSVGGGVFDFESTVEDVQDISFVPLKGERDIQREFGLTIPVRGWSLDFSHFATSSINFLDHDVLGNSNILLPLTTSNARMRGWETAIRSPELMRRLRFHLAFSDMNAQFRGIVTGGLITPLPDECLTAYCYLDHDQRNTLTTGFTLQLPGHSVFSTNIVHGSGVLTGDGPSHLAPHTTGDIQFSKTMGEGQRWRLGLTVLNVTNSRFPFDINSSFAGSHFNNPREIIGSVRYRFHF